MSFHNTILILSTTDTLFFSLCSSPPYFDQPILHYFVATNYWRVVSSLSLCRRDTGLHKPAVTRTYMQSWEAQHKWLLHEQGKKYCKLGKKHDKVNVFTAGTSNSRMTTLTRHVQSKCHQAAILECHGQAAMKSTLQSVTSKNEAAVLKALQTVSFLVKSDKTNNKYQEILEWLEFINGVGGTCQLEWWKQCNVHITPYLRSPSRLQTVHSSQSL